MTPLLLLMLAVVPADAALKVVVTTPDLAALVREAAGGAAEVASLASPFANPHFIDPRPSHVSLVMKADLFIQTGLDLEVGWAPTLLSVARNRRVLPGTPGFLDASEAVVPLDVPTAPTRAMGDVHPGGNPHYLLDPDNAARVARAAVERLCVLSPGGCPVFRANLAAFEARLVQAQKRWSASLAPARGARYAAYHKYFRYLNARYGLVQVGELEPLPGIPPTAKHTESLISRMLEARARAVVSEPWYEHRTPASVAAAAGAKTVVVPAMPGSAGSPEDYFGWMDAVVASFAGALTPTPSGAAR